MRRNFFLFKQKAAYEMRISDWSSDVCSSDLRLAERHRWNPLLGRETQARHPVLRDRDRRAPVRRRSASALLAVDAEDRPRGQAPQGCSGVRFLLEGVQIRHLQWPSDLWSSSDRNSGV